MKTRIIQMPLIAVLVVATVSVRAQSFDEIAEALSDACPKEEDLLNAAADLYAILDKAKAAADEDNKLNLCGFYMGMSDADARTLVGHYALKDGEWSLEGDPVYKIHLSLKGVRRVTKGGNTFDELAQAVAKRIGSLTQDWGTKVYSLKTIDGITVTMSESSGFTMVDTEAKAAAERKAREEREAAERKAKEEARQAALAWKGETKSVPISDSVSIQLRSIPGNLWFGQYEVTQAQWEAVMRWNPSWFKGANKPVERVSWDDCQEFLKKLNALPAVKKSGLTFRLPTGEEWEYACRAGATGNYCRLADGTEISKDTLDRVAWFDASAWFEHNPEAKTHPVGQKLPNAFGLYDMHGNVWEWTSTKMGFGSARLAYGGGWGVSAKQCESSEWYSLSYSHREDSLGFRLCASQNHP